MSEPILTFNAKSVSCNKLEKTLIGRKETVDELFNELHEKLIKGETYQSLLVAQRGSGKTHITKVIYCRLKAAKKLQNKILIAYMIEDEYGISNFVHLCIQILNAFVRYNEPGSEHIPAAIESISELASKDQEAAIKKLLLDYIGKKGLVVLLENIETVFNGMGSDAAKLRDLMHENNKISLVATAQALTDNLTKSNYPFYQFFKTRHLKKLTFEQSFELIKALASLEEEAIREPLLKELENSSDTKAKIRAVYELTSGNHRLTVHFFGFLKADIKSDLSKVFIKQMNDLKSYYEQFVKQLSVQQQRIVQLLSLSHQPLKGVDIAKKTFLSSSIVSKQLSELAKKGFIDKTKSGKDVFYELQEPLMRICFEINENPNGIAKLFVDFLKVIYEPSQLKKQFLLYKHGAKNQVGELEDKYNQEATMYGMALEEQGEYLNPEVEKILKETSKEELAPLISSTILYPMLRGLNIPSIKKSMSILITQFVKNHQINNLYNAFPNAIFHILINIESYEKEKLQSVKEYLNNTFGNIDQMKITLLMLNVGIRYLSDGDKRALFDLSKEERKVFNDFVLAPREKIN